jgi:hypothetical protein
MDEKPRLLVNIDYRFSINADVEKLHLISEEMLSSLDERLKRCSVTYFSYIKKDSTIRRAMGTLRPDVIDSFKGGDYLKRYKDLLDTLLNMFEAQEVGTMEEHLKGLKAAYDIGMQLKEKRPPHPDTFTYYDIESREFRAFTKKNLLSIYI